MDEKLLCIMDVFVLEQLTEQFIVAWRGVFRPVAHLLHPRSVGSFGDAPLGPCLRFAPWALSRHDLGSGGRAELVMILVNQRFFRETQRYV